MIIEMDGFETCSKIRELDAGRFVPILMMTGLNDSDSIDHAYKVGAADFITKLINYAILNHRVRYMYRAAQTASNLRSSKKRFERAQHMAKLGHCEWHSGELTLTCSDEVERLLLVRNESKFYPGEVVFRNIHAEDCAEISNLLQHELAHGANFQTNYRAVLEDG